MGDPLSPLPFNLIIELLIRWRKTLDKGYEIASRDLNLVSKWYDDGGILVKKLSGGYIIPPRNLNRNISLTKV